MKARALIGILILAVTILSAGCGSDVHTSGNSATVMIGLGGQLKAAYMARSATPLPSTITRVTLTVSASDIVPIITDLPLDGSTIALTIQAGANRVFTCEAFDGASITHRGTTTVSQLVTGSVMRVNIILDPLITDTTPPVVSATTPADGASGVATNSVIIATFSEAIDAATVNSGTFTLNGPAGAVGGSVGAAGTTATFTPSANLDFSSTYTATITSGVRDTAGNALALAHAWSFTTGAAPDLSPPTILSVTPADGSVNVDRGTSISATFSEGMNPATINSSTFTVSWPAGAVTANSITINGTTITFAPSALAYSTTYTATLTTGTQDLAGNALALAHSWSFTTGASPDLLPPTILSVTPADGAVNIDPGTSISATFSEGMNPATINSSTFTVSGPAGAVTANLITINGTTVTFAPSALAYSTTYTATLTTGTQDLAGNALALAYSWSFTTGAAPDISPPTILTVTPGDGSVNVDPGTSISATFSEAVYCTTLTSTSFTLAGGSAVAGTVTCSSNTATFTPSAVLVGETTYTATVTTGVRDLAGNALAVDAVWTFTTQALTSDAVAPSFNGVVIAVPSAAGGDVTLSWDPATDDVTVSNAMVYEISVATTTGAPFAVTYTTAAGATSYTVGGLTAHIDYYFVVRARDEAGNSDANTVEALTHELMGLMQLRGAPLSGLQGGVLFTYFDTCYIHTLNFGDGSSYTGDCVADQGDVIVTHQYASAGTYTATLTKQTGQSEYITLTISPAAGTWVASSELTISAGASSGGTWSGGNPDIYTPNTPGATVSVTDIESRLNAGISVTVTTSPAVSGDGDIFVNNAVSWNANALTLTAERDIKINAVMTASGSSSLLMNTATAVTGGAVKAELNAGSFIGRVDFPSRSGTGFLTINGNAYTVINSLGAAGSVTATDLQGMGGNLAGRYALGSNIDASLTSAWNAGAGFAPVGNAGTKFTGAFDGLGHTITGFSINRPATDYVGLFGYTGTGSVIRNVGLVGGSVTGRWDVGGLVGHNDTGTISNSYATGNVIGTGTGMYTGGLVGVNNIGGAISNSFATGSVSGYRYVGGLVGYNLNSSTITDSYSTGNAYALQHFVGGLAGYNDGSTINNSYAAGNVIASGDNVGGLVGVNLSGAIINSYSTGSVTDEFGGFAGGLVGQISYGTITNSYSTGSVNSGTGLYVGGLVGFKTGGTINSSYWDTQTSGQSTSSGGAGLTISQMKAQASFTGWDFTNTWSIIEGVSYPTLRGF